MADVETPPPKIDAQDPLPESNWFWRRVFVFAFCTAIAIGLWVIVQSMINMAANNPAQAVDPLYKISRLLILNGWFAMTYYMVAPSAEQVTKMWQAATMFKSGVVSTVTQVAEGPEGSKATAQTITGRVVGTGQPDIIAPSSLSVAGLPDNAGTYDGPDLSTAPTPPANTPEEAPWRPS